MAVPMAMYAPLTRGNFPHEDELKAAEISGLEKVLRNKNGSYQVGMERRVMGDRWEPEYKFLLLKWEQDYTNLRNKREVLLETTDPDQVIATLKMLISIEREPR